MKYTKKTVEIEAMQWDGLLNTPEIKRFVGDALMVEIDDSAWQVGIHPPVVSMKIKTLEGDMEVSKGDYIIKGIKGEFYPCKEDIFLASYDISGNKTAKEMFEELGFIEVERYKDIKIYELDEKKNYLKKVVFDVVKKDYECYELYEAHHNTLEISIEIHKAITKQMEELGWL